ncbi:inosine 5'-monophosphate dehydrogenase [Roseimaritima multifibrata]|uniref:Inosine 5'-monophosphate dehydrogenase n=1 Tax=Roseimaritima multifibrata TaxID=1930274 RepID=A0A517MGA3_9BACT|nr:CBS domain-containing protein [Roseimaritima multifibrata]QDS93921.1 inosine 5'-monophosphate dehydrogenase [Roseimaritima multifibrata]
MNDATQELTANDIMKVAVSTVPSTLPLPDLERQLLTANVSGFPVVDEGKLVGIVSRSDVVSQICAEREVAKETSDFYFDESGFHESKMESFKDIADRVGERIEGLKVGDVMTSNPHTIPLNCPISEIARQIAKYRFHRLPVTDHGVLVGIVTTMDLVRLIADKRFRQV